MLQFVLTLGLMYLIVKHQKTINEIGSRVIARAKFEVNYWRIRRSVAKASKKDWG